MGEGLEGEGLEGTGISGRGIGEGGFEGICFSLTLYTAYFKCHLELHCKLRQVVAFH